MNIDMSSSTIGRVFNTDRLLCPYLIIFQDYYRPHIVLNKNCKGMFVDRNIGRAATIIDEQVIQPLKATSEITMLMRLSYT